MSKVATTRHDGIIIPYCPPAIPVAGRKRHDRAPTNSVSFQGCSQITIYHRPPYRFRHPPAPTTIPASLQPSWLPFNRHSGDSRNPSPRQNPKSPPSPPSMPLPNPSFRPTPASIPCQNPKSPPSLASMPLPNPSFRPTPASKIPSIPFIHAITEPVIPPIYNRHSGPRRHPSPDPNPKSHLSCPSVSKFPPPG